MLVFSKFVYYKMFGFNFLFFRKGQGYLEDAQFKHVSCDVSLIFLYRAGLYVVTNTGKKNYERKFGVTC